MSALLAVATPTLASLTSRGLTSMIGIGQLDKIPTAIPSARAAEALWLPDGTSATAIEHFDAYCRSAATDSRARLNSSLLFLSCLDVSAVVVMSLRSRTFS